MYILFCVKFSLGIDPFRLWRELLLYSSKINNVWIGTFLSHYIFYILVLGHRVTCNRCYILFYRCLRNSIGLHNVSVVPLKWYSVKEQKGKVVVTSVGSQRIMKHLLRTLAVADVLPPRRQAGRVTCLRFRYFTSLSSSHPWWVLCPWSVALNVSLKWLYYDKHIFLNLVVNKKIFQWFVLRTIRSYSCRLLTGAVFVQRYSHFWSNINKVNEIFWGYPQF